MLGYLPLLRVGFIDIQLVKGLQCTNSTSNCTILVFWEDKSHSFSKIEAYLSIEGQKWVSWAVPNASRQKSNVALP